MPKKTPHRRIRTDKELEAAAIHVKYEVRMLLYSSWHLGIGHGSPATMPYGDDKNIALESFLLHYRNLRAFLCPSLQSVGDDDILATDFLGCTSATNVGDTNKLGTDKKRLDKMLAHLSYFVAMNISRHASTTGRAGPCRSTCLPRWKTL